MPHCILEYSRNVLDEPEPIGLLRRLNEFLAKSFDVDIRKIKSRLLPREDFVVSDGRNNQSFVHLEVALMSGRDKKTHVEISKKLQMFLKTEFSKTIASGACSLSVEVRVMDADTYVRELFGAM